MDTATGIHMRIFTMDTAMLMAMATLTKTSGMGMPTATTVNSHMRMCTVAILMAIPMRAWTTEDMDIDRTMNIAMDPLGRLRLQASSRTWTL